MPLYEYRCAYCGERFERLVPMSAADQAVNCPRCERQEARRPISQVAAVGGERCGRPPRPAEVEGEGCAGSGPLPFDGNPSSPRPAAFLGGVHRGLSSSADYRY